MNKTEATDVNTLMRAIGVAPPADYGDLDVDDSPEEVHAAIDRLCVGASRASGRGVMQGDVAEWWYRGPVIPTASLFRALDEFRGLDEYVWTPIAPAMSCIEVDALTKLIRALGLDGLAEEVMTAHRAADDHEDLGGEPVHAGDGVPSDG